MRRQAKFISDDNNKEFLFFTEGDFSKNTEFNLSIHKFPFKKDVFIQDQGVNVTKYPLEMEFNELMYPNFSDIADLFYSTIIKNKRGRLIHPVYGNLKVVANSISQNTPEKNLSSSIISVEWILDGPLKLLEKSTNKPQDLEKQMSVPHLKTKIKFGNVSSVIKSMNGINLSSIKDILISLEKYKPFMGKPLLMIRMYSDIISKAFLSANNIALLFNHFKGLSLKNISIGDIEGNLNHFLLFSSICNNLPNILDKKLASKEELENILDSTTSLFTWIFKNYSAFIDVDVYAMQQTFINNKIINLILKKKLKTIVTVKHNKYFMDVFFLHYSNVKTQLDKFIDDNNLYGKDIIKKGTRVVFYV